jgi:hypothetical protein
MDCGLMPREEHYQNDRKEELFNKQRAGWKFLTRSQWRCERGRKVVVSDEECARTYVTRSGKVLKLFSIGQAIERTREELLRDAWTFPDDGVSEHGTGS